jgi:hypothetical protein
MLYLSGSVTLRLNENVGFMHTPMMGNRIDHGRLWAADTGCYAAPHRHDNRNYLHWLQRHQSVADRCLFATAPDVVGDAVATLEKSLPMLHEIRHIGYRAALVAQDGFEEIDIPWSHFDAIFIGGTTSWKLSPVVRIIIKNAKDHQKWVHMGRVNSWKRFQLAHHMGCDSADGTHVAYAPDRNISHIHQWITRIDSMLF